MYNILIRDVEVSVKRLAVLFVVLVILGAGGALTSQISQEWGATSLPGAKVQCDDPECSVFVGESWQAGQLLILVGFLLFNIVGIGVTLAIIFWFLNKQVATAKASGGTGTNAKSNSLEKA
jgi:hypothetical protein